MTARMVHITGESDSVGRHDQGAAKSREATNSVAGGGRAWSGDEEAYLVQTRLQKMPYKHIAAHLKKTELACRLHYHQLSRSSGGRRRRGWSISSGSGSDHSSEMPSAPVPGPIRDGRRSDSLSHHPGRSDTTANYQSASPRSDLHLPSIAGPSASPGQPTILPRLAMSMSASENSGYACRYPYMMMNLPRYRHTTTALDESPLFLPSTSAHAPTHVDLSRLQAIYNAHRDSFWNIIASEYGSNMPPDMLETVWKRGMRHQEPPPPPPPLPPINNNRPLTPAASPETGTGNRGSNTDKIRIASMLTTDDFPLG